MSDETWEPPQTRPHWLEWLERARGRLYDFHQMCGRVDLLLGQAADELAAAGHGDLAEAARTHVVGRNIVEGRWSFQVVEEYDASYYDVVRSFAAHTEDALVDGARHVFESEMKDDRRTDGLAAQRRRPEPGS